MKGGDNYGQKSIDRCCLSHITQRRNGNRSSRVYRLRKPYRFFIPQGVAHIGNKTFAYCVNLKKVFIPGTVVEIGDCAFAECPLLTDVLLQNGLQRLGGAVIQNYYTLPEDEANRIIIKYNGHYTDISFEQQFSKVNRRNPSQ